MNLFDWIFPKLCLGCGKLGTYLCSSCIKEINQAELVCPTCARLSIGGATHPLCRKKYSLDGLWSLASYGDSMRVAIQKLKYRFISDLGVTLVDLMIEYWVLFSPSFLEEIKKDRGEGWLIVPVPLHPKRERFRGFNQSALLGKIISQKIGLKYIDILKRVINTKTQVGMGKYERGKNIKNAFSLNSKSMLTNTNIILIDDVWTTGSTLKECCFVLKRNGAKKVWAITLAR